MGISCIVLASGMSKRMGQNKLTLKLKGKMIIEYILDSIKQIEFDEVIVVTRFTEVAEYAKSLDYTIVENKEYFKGQSSSIKLGVENSKKRNDYMFFMGDQPSLKPLTIIEILKHYSGKDNEIVVPYYNGKKGNPVIFGNLYRGDLLNLSGDSGGSSIIKNNKNNIKIVNIQNDENQDIDSIEDYEIFRRKHEK